MPRPERPLDGRGGPVEELAAELRLLRDKAGKPGYRQMAARVNYSVATLSAAASGRRLPTLEVTLAYVAACDGDPGDWERRWRQAERLTVAPADEPAAADGDGRSPYPGLATFRPEDADLFFGRDALVDDLVSRLGQRRFLAVFGASGAGKSSVVRAGLVPAWGGPAVVLTPGTHPLAELAVHLARRAGVAAGGVLDDLRADPGRAALLVRQGLPAAGDLLVVVDQFEEVFAGGADPVERTGFVAALLAMCREPDGRARVVLAVRADHYARFAEHPELLAALTDAQVLIGGMSPAQLREAVTKPAERRGARVEGALVATIVAQVTGSPGALPLAAHALREAWRRRQGAMVTLAGYEAAGGVAGAVAHTAEAAYDRLSEPERAAARRVLLRMVDVGPDGVIIRRRLDRAELDGIERAPAVVEAFAGARLVSTGRDTVEIAHEALIRAWPRLRGWVEQSRAGLRQHRRLTEAAATWEALGRDDGALYRGLRLSNAVEALDAETVGLTGPEREFLEASRALRDREARLGQRRTRRLFAGLVAVLAVVSVLAAGAVLSARRASAERDRAVARELAAGARAERMTDPELALLLASRAYRLHPDDETESVLRQATADTRTTYTMDAHGTEIYSVGVSGSQAVSADLSGDLKVWDPRGRSPAVTAPVRGTYADFGPDGRMAIATSDPSTRSHQVVLWKPGEAARPLHPAIAASAMAVAYSPDGRWAAMLGDDSHAYVWDTTRDGVLRSLPFTGVPGGLAFGPGGRLAVASDDGTVRIWDVATTSPPVVIRQPGDRFPAAVAFSPDGRRIAVGGSGKVTVRSADGRGMPQTLLDPEFTYISVAFSPDGRRVAAGAYERTVRIWDVADGSRGLILRGHHGAVRDVQFTPDGRSLVSGSDDATARVWDVTGAGDPEAVPLPASRGPALLSGDGSAVASVNPGTVSVLGFHPPRTTTTLPGARPDTRILAVGAHGRAVAARAGERLSWWPAGDGGPPGPVDCGPQPPGPIGYTAALSGDGRVLALDCGDYEVRVWHAGNPKPAASVEGNGPIAISPDATRLALIQQGPVVVLWDPAADRVVRSLSIPGGNPDHARFSPDGRLLAVSGDDGAIRVWTVAGDAGPVVLTGTAGQTTAIGFSPDGRLIAGIGTDDVLRVWNTDGSGEALTFAPPADARDLAFSADGRELITVHDDHLRITPCEVCGPIGEVLALAAQRTTRDFTPEERAKYLRS
ncbi:hypothetical protein ACGFJ7_33895 [Actinoplanes sp. NPDC048988]|uniref:nSTAND1 domain-containing NTPase n=1 Tax=Actinoplanes sp. NPDC048988 TaxID=3363901 RepID=UPI00371BFD43